MSQEILRILGQARPAGGTEVVVYTVPEGLHTALSAIAIVNNGAGNVSIDLSIVKGGSGDIAGNPTLPVNKILDQFPLLAAKSNSDPGSFSGKGVTLDEYDDIRFETTSTDVVIHVYGVEVAPDKN